VKVPILMQRGKLGKQIVKMRCGTN